MKETQDTRILSLDGEDSLEEEMAVHSIFLPENPMWEPGGLQSMGLQKILRQLSD